MTFLEKIGLNYLHRFDPEKAHEKSINFLKRGLVPKREAYTSARLAQTLCGLDLPNPVGLAAGYDKNAEVIAPLLQCGFGFIEVGAVTPRAQEGNRKPRLFRLTEDQAAINRFGFNNQGMGFVGQRLAARPSKGIVGVNLGANKDSEHRVFDYVDVLEHLGPYVDFATVNVSSPNTERLRDLQGKQALEHLLDGVMQTRDKLDRSIPIFLKIAPDLTDEEIAQIAQVARHARIDAIIATNTTLARDGLQSADRDQKGGLSGKPLFAPSTMVLAKLASQLEGAVPLIGVGGISSAQDAFDKICAGASAVQIYTALVYQGISLADDIAKGLDQLLAQAGYEHISQAVGSRMEEFL